jgi:hypothetical protein
MQDDLSRGYPQSASQPDAALPQANFDDVDGFQYDLSGGYPEIFTWPDAA